MHGYSTDSSERRFVPLLLAALAVVCAWLCSKLMAAAHFSTPWWLDAPSSLAFYGVLNTLFDKHLWRNRLVRKLGLSRVPNLTGRWRGFLVSSFDGHVKRHDVLLQIFQSWTQISIYLTTITSISRSCVAELQVSDPAGVALIYQYQNQPLSYAMKSMHMHFGTAMLRLSDKSDCLAGEYYSGRDRRTYGQIWCWREHEGVFVRYVHLLEMIGGKRKAS
jgi:SMODS-associating 2TM, beta-strand rich effector domain